MRDWAFAVLGGVLAVGLFVMMMIWSEASALTIFYAVLGVIVTMGLLCTLWWRAGLFKEKP